MLVKAIVTTLVIFIIASALAAILIIGLLDGKKGVQPHNESESVKVVKFKMLSAKKILELKNARINEGHWMDWNLKENITITGRRFGGKHPFLFGSVSKIDSVDLSFEIHSLEEPKGFVANFSFTMPNPRTHARSIVNHDPSTMECTSEMQIFDNWTSIPIECQ